MKTSFRHRADERNRSKVLNLRMKLGAAGYGVYMMLLERLTAEPDFSADMDYDVLAYDFHVDAELIRKVVEDFDLFVIDMDREQFSHEELNRQFIPGPQKAQQQADKFIEGKCAETEWIEDAASAYNTSPERIRSILHTSFRAKLLAEHPKLPSVNTLNHLLELHLANFNSN